jgi:hypothetical protein
MAKEELQKIISDGSLPVEERDEATRLLAELEKRPQNIWDATIAKVKWDYEERTGQPFPKARA